MLGVVPVAGFEAGALAGFVAAYGWWGWQLYELTGNPIFPLFNQVFHSAWVPALGGTDRQYLPRDLGQWLFYPLYWLGKNQHIVTEVMPIIGPMTCNKFIFPQLRAALIEIQDLGLASKITNYAGCYNPRFIAGTTTLSNHAFGLAFDIDPAQNARGTVGQMDRGVVAVFEKWGFTWGGTWSYTDPMHFELNRIVKPGS